MRRVHSAAPARATRRRAAQTHWHPTFPPPLPAAASPSPSRAPACPRLPRTRGDGRGHRAAVPAAIPPPAVRGRACSSTRAVGKGPAVLRAHPRGVWPAAGKIPGPSASAALRDARDDPGKSRRGLKRAPRLLPSHGHRRRAQSRRPAVRAVRRGRCPASRPVRGALPSPPRVPRHRRIFFAGLRDSAGNAPPWDPAAPLLSSAMPPPPRRAA